MTDTTDTPVDEQHRSRRDEPDHWFGGTSGGRVVVTGLLGTSTTIAWFASASLLVALLAAVGVLVAAVAVALSL